MFEPNANFNNVNFPDKWYWDIYRKDLRKLINLLEMGLETPGDMSATIGILSMFLKSNEEFLIAEAQRYLKRNTSLQKFFPEIEKS